MKGEVLVVLAGLGLGAYLLQRHHKHKLHELHRHAAKHHIIEAPDVYSGEYIDPIRPTFPHDAVTRRPHRDIHTGKLISNHSPFPSQPTDVAEQFVISKIVNEFTAEGRLGPSKAAQLRARIEKDYMHQIAWIARNNGYKRKPLHGEPLSKYSALILQIADNHGLYLSPSARARYQAQMYYVPKVWRHSVHHVGASNVDKE